MLLSKKILVVVPARGGSKGIKLKNLRKVNGIPLVAIAGKVAVSLPYVDRAVVSTDHPEIRDAAVLSGLDAPFMRPDSLSGDIVGDTEVLTHALLEMEKIDNVQYDVIVMLQPTSPMRTPEHVTQTVTKLIEKGYDAVWTVSETDSKSHPLKQLVIEGDRLDYYDEDGNKIIARQQLKPVYHRNGAAYAITRSCLLESKSIKGENTSAVIIKMPLVNIDTEFDLQLLEFISQSIK